MGFWGDVAGVVGAPFTGGASLLATGLGNNFVSGQPAGVKDPFPQSTNPFANFTQSQIQGLFNSPGLQQAFGANPLENFAAQGLLNYNPYSFFQGPYGGMNPGAGKPGGSATTGLDPLSLLGSAKGALGSDQYGANNLLSQTVGGQFTDPTKNPFYQQQAQGAKDQAQQFLNQQFDQIQGSQQRASGGVANTSVMPQLEANAAANVSTQLGAQLAGIQGNIYEQERANQQGALMQALGLPFQQASALGGIAGLGGNLALGFGQQNLNQQGMLAGLGGTLQNRDIAGFQFPLSQALQYLATSRGIPMGATPSPLGGLLGGAGSLFGGLGLSGLLGGGAAGAGGAGLLGGGAGGAEAGLAAAALA